MKLSFPARLAVLACLALLLPIASHAAPRHPNAQSLDADSRQLFEAAMRWGDEAWDPHVRLCKAPVNIRTDGTAVEGQTADSFMVRNTVWYALGLLLRDKPGDRDRAAAALRVILNAQYHEPDKPWDGTFRLTPTDPEPVPHSLPFRGYDPNWRVFIGTAFAEMLLEYPDRLPADLRTQMMNSIVYAVNGEIKEKRLKPTYTNIALMYGFLWNYAAVHANRPDWVAPSTAWQEEVYRLFKLHDAFWEFNSPTYSGTDLFALEQWRDYGSTEHIRAMGSEMEATLWRTIADLYNADLRNISGPYDRAYGMDMTSYVSEVGLHLRTVLDADHAPLPSLDHSPVDHVADLWHVPAMVILDTHIPDDAMKSFRSFQGAHQVHQPIADDRIATAWIGRHVIYGGEITGHTRGVDEHSQFHPVTAHWKSQGKISWIEIIECPPIDASADQKGIAITANGDVKFRILAPGAAATNAIAAQWTLPGLTVSIDTDAKSFTTEPHGDFLEVEYKGMTKMFLAFKPDEK